MILFCSIYVLPGSNLKHKEENVGVYCKLVYKTVLRGSLSVEVNFLFKL